MTRCPSVLALLTLCAAVLAAAAPRAALAQRAAVEDYESFLRRLPNGLVTVDALDLPAEFLARVADRSRRAHFRLRRRVIEADPPAAPVAAETTGRVDVVVREGAEAIPPSRLEVWRTVVDEVRARTERAPETDIVPELRGYRAPVFDGTANVWPLTVRGGPSERRDRARTVAEHLARDGLVRTTMRALADKRITWQHGDGLDEQGLRELGVPVDLLAMYSVQDEALPAVLIRWIRDGGRRTRIGPIAEAARLDFRPTMPGFTIAPDDGTAAPSALRLQLPGSRYARRRGDGSTLDVVRQIVAVDAGRVWITAGAADIGGVRAALSAWELPRPEHVVVIAVPMRPSQWAQDSARPGVIHRDGQAPAAATLVPRYPSRNEQMSKFVPADAVALEGLPVGAGERAVSPLLFQGGNLLAATDPARAERVLLVGEAEVHRNRALGLGEAEVLEALRIEFGVDRCVVLPSVSFHIDMEVTVRAVGPRLVAAVIDDVAAARCIVGAGVDALEAGGYLPAETAAMVRHGLPEDAMLPRTVHELLSAIDELRDDAGAFPQAAARALTAGEAESPAANAARFLLAVDVLAAACADRLAALDEDERGYRRSLQRRLLDRAALARRLAEEGMGVCRIPSLGDEEVGINYVNVVHLPDTALVPVHGGFYAALDEAALAAYRAAYGPDVRLAPIVSADTQTRYGGVHCMTSVHPAP